MTFIEEEVKLIDGDMGAQSERRWFGWEKEYMERRYIHA